MLTYILACLRVGACVCVCVCARKIVQGRFSSHFCSDLTFSQRVKRATRLRHADGRQAGKEAGEDEEARDEEARDEEARDEEACDEAGEDEEARDEAFGKEAGGEEDRLAKHSDILRIDLDPGVGLGS